MQHDDQNNARIVRPWPLTGATLLGLMLFSLAQFGPGLSAAAGIFGIGLFGLTLWSLRSDPARPVLAPALVAALLAYAGFGLVIWPLAFLVPLIVVALLGLSTRIGGEWSAALRFGKFGSVEALLVVAISLLSGGALYLWAVTQEPDLSRLQAMLPSLSLAGLVATGFGFAVLNALMEEFIWRGVLQHWLKTLMPVALAVIVQALSFGVIHWVNGFPSGLIGALLATGYGLMLGALAQRSQGLGAPIIAHIFADAMIFGILVTFS